MKKLLTISVLLLAMVLTACGTTSKDEQGSGAGTEPKEPEFADVLTALKEKLAEDHKADGVEDWSRLYLEADLTDTSGDDPAPGIWTEKMKLDPEKLANGTVIAALMNVNADEIILLEAKSKDDVADLKASLENELAAQTQTWEQYLPEQFDKVKANKIVTKGKYLLYVTYTDPAGIEKVFHDQMD
ncbi:hypothetical protein NCCP2716_26710 [Sporosarcina sp. NCCP-2716]|uniref:DUF4358 domain-containing protein n=1 Tax=Sporosarcina sp. NCCP-2716 TaxID=2943679 RepID=UPI002041B90E|nr:DUF4358 domain-containing protein [Sporosarcina sp. NCCP-2716]GKV70173.1 hypothetical protein NCCP2716_26710 [Sporosarcina sp. NCCP-2716]